MHILALLEKSVNRANYYFNFQKQNKKNRFVYVCLRFYDFVNMGRSAVKVEHVTPLSHDTERIQCFPEVSSQWSSQNYFGHKLAYF